MQKALLFSIVCLTGIAAVAQSPTELSRQIDNLVDPLYVGNVPGISILVAEKGQIVFEKAWGSANLELNVPLKPQMIFDLASITKQFTAVAILQLVEKGKLSLNDSVQKYIPDYPSKGTPITIENLLTHTSGIPDYMQMSNKGPFLQRRDFMPKELIDLFKNEPLDFKPGTEFKYSNSGYYLLGYIIQAVTHEGYGKYVKENILEPLGLTHTFYNWPNEIIPDHVYGYQKESENYEKADFWSPTIAYAAGGLASNVEDLFKWHQGLYSYKILKEELLKQAQTTHILSNGDSTGYGYGWYVSNTNGIRSISHGGAMTGFRTNEAYYPQQDVYVAILCNCECARVDTLAYDIAGMALGKPLQADIEIKNLGQYVGTYTMVSNPGRTIIISREGDHLAATISGQGSFPLVFQSERNFSLKGILNLTCDFTLEHDQVTGFIAHQNGEYTWKKIR